MAHLKTAAYRRFVLPPEPRRPGEAQGRRKIILVAIPESLFRIRRTFSDQDDLRQIASLRATSGMESFSESTARIPEDGGTASHKTSGPVLTGHAEEKGHSKQIITDAKIQSEMGSHFPIILDKEVELILIVPANSSAGRLR